MNIAFGDYMKEWCFKQLKLLLPKIMVGETRKEFDDWWIVKNFFDNYTPRVK